MRPLPRLDMRSHTRCMPILEAEGVHYYYSYPESGLGNSASTIAAKVDVRGDGGFVVAPPSVHRSGCPYEWVEAPDMVDLTDPPAWMLATKAGTKAKVTNASPSDRVSPGEWTMPVEQGSRNNTAARLAGASAREGEGEEEVLDRLREWNSQCCQPALEDGEIAQVVASVFKMEHDRREGARSSIAQMMTQMGDAGTRSQADLR